MKLLTIKSAIAILTFLASIGTVTFLLNKSSNDTIVYSVKFCDFMNNTSSYDGKIIRIQGIYHQGTERVHLIDNDCSNQMLRVTYASWDENSTRMMQQLRAVKFPDKARVDVIGKFNANVIDPDPPIDGSFFHPKINLFEISELKGIETIKNQ